MTLDELQRLENNPALRIKFASIRSDGSVAADAGDEYAPFFAALQAEVPNWTEEASTQTVQTRFEAARDAHVLRHGGAEIAAVEHETGIEIIATGMAINVASAALIGLVGWSWTTWKELRDAQRALGVEKAEPALALEGVRERDQDGSPKEIVRLERRGLMTADSVSHQLEEFIARVGGSNGEEDVSLASGSVNLTFNFHFNR